MRNVGVGHQSPNTKSVSTSTFDNEFSDKWLPEKMKFLNREMTMPKPIVISRETQTLLPNEKRDVGLQYRFEAPQITKYNAFTQTAHVEKIRYDKGVLYKVPSTETSVQSTVDSLSIGVSDDTIFDNLCNKCSTPKKSVSVGPENAEDTHTSQISLASLSVRSKSFNLGDDSLNLSKRTRTTASQYESNTVNRSSHADIKPPSSSKAAQVVPKTQDTFTQTDRQGVSRYTDTLDLKLVKKDVAVEARQAKPKTTDVSTNTNVFVTSCSKCDKEKDKEEIKDGIKKDGGSPTPSRIPRPQIPTTPVEIRKFRRQDTYTKIYSPTEKSSPSSPTHQPLR